jgi:uncharacterized protein YqfA (UPF0365 family)
MKAEVAENRAKLMLAKADVPLAMAAALRNGKLHIRRPARKGGASARGI